MRRIVLGLIRTYQGTLSPDHGPLRARYPGGYCKFYPSCSEYGYQAFERHGLLAAFGLTAWRILRCHPWSKGGMDPVPDTKKSS